MFIGKLTSDEGEIYNCTDCNKSGIVSHLHDTDFGVRVRLFANKKGETQAVIYLTKIDEKPKLLWKGNVNNYIGL